MSDKTPDWLESGEIYRLKGVFSWELNQNHGDFLKAFFQAFLRADPSNSRILLPAAKALETKYHLVDGTKPDR